MLVFHPVDSGIAETAVGCVSTMLLETVEGLER